MQEKEFKKGVSSMSGSSIFNIENEGTVSRFHHALQAGRIKSYQANIEKTGLFLNQ